MRLLSEMFFHLFAFGVGFRHEFLEFRLLFIGEQRSEPIAGLLPYDPDPRIDVPPHLVVLRKCLVENRFDFVPLFGSQAELFIHLVEDMGLRRAIVGSSPAAIVGTGYGSIEAHGKSTGEEAN